MSEVTEACSCWTVQTADGTRRNLGWVDLHEYVSVVTQGGRVVKGFALGVGLSRTLNQPIDDYEVQVHGEPSTTFIEREDICTVTPDGGYDHLDPLLTDLAVLLQDPRSLQDSEEPTFLRYVIGSHSAIEVEVRHVAGRCSPQRARL